MVHRKPPEMKIKNVVWDLCSGLGGWSEAFVQDDWIVIRVEINPDLTYIPHTLHFDVKDYLDWMYLLPKPDLILASPPCTEFSLAQNYRGGRPDHPDMSILEACIDIIKLAQPKYWCIENVSGACKHFEPYLGKHTQRAGPFYLWGNFPYVALDPSWTHNKEDQVKGPRSLRSNQRGKIPFMISFKMLQAFRQQKTLEEYL
jgi:hypothetical protein